MTHCDSHGTNGILGGLTEDMEIAKKIRDSGSPKFFDPHLMEMRILISVDF